MSTDNQENQYSLNQLIATSPTPKEEVSDEQKKDEARAGLIESKYGQGILPGKQYSGGKTEAKKQIQYITQAFKEEEALKEAVKNNPKARLVSYNPVEEELKETALRTNKFDLAYNKSEQERLIQADAFARHEFSFLEMAQKEFFGQGTLAGKIPNFFHRMQNGTELTQEEFYNHRGYDDNLEYTFGGRPITKEFMDWFAREKDIKNYINDMQSGINIHMAPSFDKEKREEYLAVVRANKDIFGVDTKNAEDELQYSQTPVIAEYKPDYKKEGYGTAYDKFNPQWFGLRTVGLVAATAAGGAMAIGALPVGMIGLSAIAAGGALGLGVNTAKVAGVGANMVIEGALMQAAIATAYAPLSAAASFISRSIMRGVVEGNSAIRNSYVANKFMFLSPNTARMTDHIKKVSPTVYSIANNALHTAKNIGRSTFSEQLVKSSKTLSKVGIRFSIGTAEGVGYDYLNHMIEEKWGGAIGLANPGLWKDRESHLTQHFLGIDAHGTIGSVIDNLLFTAAIDGSILGLNRLIKGKTAFVTEPFGLDALHEMEASMEGNAGKIREIMTNRNNQFNNRAEYMAQKSNIAEDLTKSKIKNFMEKDIEGPLMNKILQNEIDMDLKSLDSRYELSNGIQELPALIEKNGMYTLNSFHPVTLTKKFINNLYDKFGHMSNKKYIKESETMLQNISFIDIETIAKRGHLTEPEIKTLFPKQNSQEAFLIATNPDIKQSYDRVMSFLKTEHNSGTIWHKEAITSGNLHLDNAYAHHKIAQEYDKHITVIDNILENTGVMYSDTDLHRGLKLQRDIYETRRAIHALESYTDSFDKNGKLHQDFFSNNLREKYGEDSGFHANIDSKKLDQGLIKLKEELKKQEGKIFKQNKETEKIFKEAETKKKEYQEMRDKNEEVKSQKMSDEHTENMKDIDDFISCMSSGSSE